MNTQPEIPLHWSFSCSLLCEFSSKIIILGWSQIIFGAVFAIWILLEVVKNVWELQQKKINIIKTISSLSGDTREHYPELGSELEKREASGPNDYRYCRVLNNK